MIESNNVENYTCPLPLPHRKAIVMGHGSGGKMTHDLIRKTFLKAFENPIIHATDDAARLDLPEGSQLAVSTDSHVVFPLFFSGGDIGRLAVCGTVNDVSMLGAIPLYLTAGFILEEGLEISLLEKVLASMKEAAREAGVFIVAGDTKVVQKGKADGLYINTTGIGKIPPGIEIGGQNARPGDVIILSGTIGDHGIAVLEARNELGFSSGIKSDVAPLNHLVEAIVNTEAPIHVLRDPTRGGLATSLNEIASQSQVCITIDETSIPVTNQVAAVCEILGYDPLFVANEGKMIVILPEQKAAEVLAIMQHFPYGERSTIIGRISDSPKGRVLMRTSLGTTRIVDMLSGEMLPRIC
jgi:hydrogenase expression/formation protein HypE